MKKLFYLFSFALLALTACQEKVTETVTYKINEPVFMSADEFRNSVRVSPQPQVIESQGKMCFYQGYLYISEPGKGVHIIDNRDPSQPKSVGFIELIGNADLSIRNNLLYADALVDLVWFNITNPAAPTLTGRLEKVFADALPPIENTYSYDYQMCYGDIAKDKGVVVGWTVKERTEEITYYTGGWWGGTEKVFDGAFTTNGSASSTGITGSMSRFAIYSDYLYAVINNNMTIFDLNADKPAKTGDNIYIGRNVETIFSYKDNMFMGTPTGMIIYSVSNPSQPVYQSMVSHVYGCDPVVVENDMAYVTVHSGNLCGQNNNELFIVDVSDVKKPKQIVAYSMVKPKGLGIDNGKLFVCDDGLKVYKVGDPQKLMSNQLAHIKGMDGFDVIPYNNTLMMIAEDGLYQYDYTDINDIKLLSKISIKKK